MSHDRIEINGAPATTQDLRQLVQNNYGHFSAMQVRDGAVRGLDLHLDRLENSTRELFGSTLDREHVRACLRHAVAGAEGTLSVRVNIFSREFNREHPLTPAKPDVLVMTSNAPSRPNTPLRLKSFRYQRDLPHIKHVGTFALFQHRRQAQVEGFDDAVFVDEDGYISEGSIWNIGFFTGDEIIWPQAPRLSGTSMQVLQRGLQSQHVATGTRRIALAEIGGFQSAFFTNAAVVARSIASIDSVQFRVDEKLIAMLERCHETQPWQVV